MSEDMKSNEGTDEKKHLEKTFILTLQEGMIWPEEGLGYREAIEDLE